MHDMADHARMDHWTCHASRRFLDIVPINAGKLEALEYVRQRHNFPVGSTVACGDSGNDILMLAGAWPANESP